LDLLAAPPAQRQLGLHWWHWRRAHQTTARRCHIARRAGQQPPGEAAPVVVTVPGTPHLTETHWTQVAALLPTNGRRGRPPQDHRRILTGMLWVMHTGAAWRELPREFGVWQTIYSRYTRWRREGTWTRILAILLQPSPWAPT
jgi:hypothetical protein